MPPPGPRRPAEPPRPNPWERLLYAALGAGAFATVAWLGGTRLGRAFAHGSPVAVGLTALFLGALAVRLGLWLRYRPTARPSQAALPPLTVVIPAFNEGALVADTIAHVLAADYPPERLTVIAVDDGSTDDTAAHIRRAARAHPGRVTVVELPENRGKRHALYAGFKLAESPIVATIDSDSLVARDGLANLVAPFVADPSVGGVAGRVLVLNRGESFITRMLGVRYIIGFDFIRAYQSELGTVWCCPGALQAYRLDAIRPHLEAWRDQHFLGAACTNGDDHAMSNLVLSLGYKTVYQASSQVETVVPATYVGLSKMYLRWGRSATREGLRALRFAPHRALALGLLRGPLMLLDAVLQPLTIALRIAGLFAGSFLFVVHPHALLGALGATAAFALLYALIYLRSERSAQVVYGVLYAYFALFALPWVQPYATLTVRRNGWLTRK